MFQNVTLNTTSCEYSPGESSVLWWNSLGGIPDSEVYIRMKKRADANRRLIIQKNKIDYSAIYSKGKWVCYRTSRKVACRNWEKL